MCYNLQLVKRIYLTAQRLTDLALLADNGFKTQNFFKPTNFKPANSGQVRVETVSPHFS